MLVEHTVVESPTETNPIILRETAREQVRLYPSVYRKKTKVHLRKFWREDESGDWKPSREGVALSPEELPMVISALQVLQAQIAQEG